MKYLGIPLNKVRIRIKDWKPYEDRIEKICAYWRGRMMNIFGRLTLVQSSLTNIPMLMMSFYSMHSGGSK